MKAGFLKTIGIILRTVARTLQTAIFTFYFAMIGKLTRAKCDYLILKWAQNTLKIVKARLVIHNPYNVVFNPNSTNMLMCNHTSHYDIPITFCALPKCSIRMLAKKELFKIPVFGFMLKHSQFPSIDRTNIEKAKLDLKKAQNVMQSGIVLWIAPEGTRSETGKIQIFKKGGFIVAIESQAVITPIYIAGSNKILPAKTWSFYTDQTVHVYIGKPIHTNNFTVEQKEILMNKVKDQWVEFEKSSR